MKDLKFTVKELKKEKEREGEGERTNSKIEK